MEGERGPMAKCLLWSLGAQVTPHKRPLPPCDPTGPQGSSARPSCASPKPTHRPSLHRAWRPRTPPPQRQERQSLFPKESSQAP